MDTFPELHTPRLKLARLTADDIPALVRYANNRKISDQVLNIPHPYDEPDAVFRISYVLQGFKSKARYVFAITLRERAELIGEIGLHLDNGGKIAQLGYWVGEPFWNKGIASESVKAALTFGFGKLGLDLVYATCHIDNPASARVLEKNGMTQRSINGNVAQYVLSKESWEAAKDTA